MLNHLLRLYRDDQAATAAEYAVLLALILVAIISAINAVGNGTRASGPMMRAGSKTAARDSTATGGLSIVALRRLSLDFRLVSPASAVLIG